jgi:hypothetical protein
MSVDHASPIYVAVLGTDALLAARPVDSVQLTRACQRAGFDFVAPVSWGEELIASKVAEVVAEGASAVVIATCPLVDDKVADAPFRTPILRTVSPPVATARYLRAALHPRPVHVTYVGACPGAAHPEVDAQCLPDALFTRLAESGIDASQQPRHLDAQLPVDRSRYASTPGGVPAANWLMARAGVRLVEAAPITVDVVAEIHRDERLLIDLSSACRCVCARDRTAAARIEPPRATQPVVGEVRISISTEPEPEAEAGAEEEAKAENPDQREPESTTEQPVDADRRAKFAENGLSGGEAAPIPPMAHTFTRAVEPW